MATYKVIQDIEAEDHILGPLSLRQFIYGLISVFFLYLCFICITKHAVFLLILFFPPALFTGFFAFPFGKDQPTEVWALAKLRYFFKPRKRIWNQSGIKELVSITVPKKIEVQLTNGLNQSEVKSRLEALANTIDSRGWAIKNAASGGYPALLGMNEDSDRLVGLSAMPQAVPDYTVPDSEDMLDEQASPLAQQFTQLINTSAQNHRQQIVDQLNEVAPPAPTVAVDPQWFSSTSTLPPTTAPSQPAVVDTSAGGLPISSEPTAEEAALVARGQQQNAAAAQANAHMHTLKPQSDDQPSPHLNTVALPPITPSQVPTDTGPVAADPAILKLANNNDLNVATLAREAGKVKELDASEGEVVIALH